MYRYDRTIIHLITVVSPVTLRTVHMVTTSGALAGTLHNCSDTTGDLAVRLDYVCFRFQDNLCRVSACCIF